MTAQLEHPAPHHYILPRVMQSIPNASERGTGVFRPALSVFCRDRSATQGSGQRHQVAGMPVVACLRQDILGLGQAPFQWPFDVGRAQAAGAGGGQIVMVGRDQHHLLGLQVKGLGHAQVGGGVRLVGAKDFGAQDAVPGQAGALGHMGQQTDVAIGQGDDGIAVFETLQPGYAVGPGIQPVPDVVQVLAFGLAQVA